MERQNAALLPRTPSDMNTITAILTVPAALALGFVAGRAATTVDASPVVRSAAPVAALQDDDAATLTEPGDEHRMLDVFEGSWNALISSYMPGVEQPIVMDGTLTGEWTLGGRFLKQTYEVGMGEGQVFTGTSFMGYSPAERVFESVWMDNSNVDMATASGFAAPDGMSFTMLTNEIDPTTRAIFEIEERISIESRDAFSYERYRMTDEGEVLQMRIEHTRVGSGAADGQDG